MLHVEGRDWVLSCNDHFPGRHGEISRLEADTSFWQRQLRGDGGNAGWTWFKFEQLMKIKDYLIYKGADIWHYDLLHYSLQSNWIISSYRQKPFWLTNWRSILELLPHLSLSLFSLCVNVIKCHVVVCDFFSTFLLIQKSTDSVCPQVGFFSGICLPCYELLAKLIPELTPMLENCADNLASWKQLADQRKWGDCMDCNIKYDCNVMNVVRWRHCSSDQYGKYHHTFLPTSSLHGALGAYMDPITLLLNVWL